MEMAIRLFIVSDNRLFRETLARIFSKKTGIEMVGSCASGADAASEVADSNPEVLVLDSAALLCSGLAGLTQKRERGIKVVIVAMDEDEDLFLEVVRQGACGYVPNDASAIELVNAVRMVARGEAVCPPRLCKRLFELVAQQLRAPVAQGRRAGKRLTRREAQLVPMIDHGLTNKEIAAQLNLSEQTIKNHVHRILRKVGAENRLCVATACGLNGGSVRESSYLRSMRPS
jgi:DNA-binding NarL/FixJ family response regulator